jgi:hypothetical protein
MLLALLSGTAAAHAASAADKAAARQHAKQAEELKKQGQLAEACKHWEEVERLDPKLPTIIELAECNEQAGNLVAAQAQWSVARDRAKHDEKPQSRAKAEAHLAAVQKRVAHLTLQLAPAAGAQVLSDDVALDPASLGSALPMNPGDHVIVVKLVGHDDAKYAVKLAPGDSQTLAIAAGRPASAASVGPAPGPLPVAAAPSAPPASAPPAATTAAPTEAPPAPTGWWSTAHTAGVILGAVGLAAVGGGTALCVGASKDDSKLSSSAHQRLALGGISIAGGGVLLISGIALLTSSSSDAAQHAQQTLAPTLLLARGATVIGAAGEF